MSEEMGSTGSRNEERGKESEQVDRSESAPEEKRYDPDDPTLTVVEAEDQLDFELDNFQSPRALMSCGHAVTPTSLTNWCRRQLDEGNGHFVCGVFGCDAEWSFQEVCQMALLTPEELHYFENRIFDNAKDRFDIKSCPGCKSTVMRSNFNNLCVKCTVCSSDHGAPFFFCWQCLREWRGPSPRKNRCDNKGCYNKSLKTLKNCPDTSLLHVMGVTSCPSIRACPTCGLLLEHNKTGCKTLTCPRCMEKFCFVCLKNIDDCCRTSEVFDACSSGVAPRQTSVPVMKW